MGKRIPLGIAIAAILIFVIATAVTTVFVFLDKYDELLSELPARAQQYEKLAEVDELVRREYYGEIDSDSVDSGLAQGYLSGLDENCFYIAPEYYDYYSRTINGNLSGIGINAYFDSSFGGLKITKVSDDSPADLSGFAVDGYIVSVDGNDITKDNYAYYLNELTESYDKSFTLEYCVDSQSESSQVHLTSGYFEKSVVYIESDNIGYIRISAFYDNTAELFSEAIEVFRTKGIDSIIIDLRNTVSSNIDSASEVIDLIVPVGTEGRGAIYIAKNASGSIVKQVSSDSSAINMNIVVLVNSRTQCAAELFACDLRDFGKALIFGETTHGNGTYQKLFRLDDGGAVSLTVAEIFPYISESFNGVGVIPDVEILTSDSFKNQLGSYDFTDDDQYNKAFSYLSTQ